MATLDTSFPADTRPRLTLRGVSLAALCWLLYAVVYALVIVQGEAVPFGGALISQIVQNALLGVLSIPVWLLIFRTLAARSGVWKLGAHVLIAPVYTAVSYHVYIALLEVMAGERIASAVVERETWIMFGMLTTYVLQFAVYHTIHAAQRYRLGQQQAAELQALARQQELTALKAQINPHFLFNTLNSISAMATQDGEETREMISRLADLLRYALDSSERDLVPLGDELDFARAYLALERHRFPDRLTVEYDLDDGVEDVAVPPMVLQPLVENAVRHGIAPSEQGGVVRVRAVREGGVIHVSVEDTGVGLNGVDLHEQVGVNGHAGIGLRNTNARLQSHFGSDGALHVERNTPRGVCVWFDVPGD